MPELRKETNITTQAVIVGLKSTGQQTSAEVAAAIGLSVRQVNRIYARAIERGFDPCPRPIQIDNAFVADAARSGRLKKQEEAKEAIALKVRRDRFGREKTYADLAGELSLEGTDISATTI